jgi:uncharacterized protein (TIGR03435 family)
MPRFLLIGVLAVSAAFGQSFEVASIKPAEPPADGRMFIRMRDDDGRLDYVNVSLRDVIRNAYKLRDHQISGPDWLGSERYNIQAKFPAGATKADVPVMLQALLTERFKLTYHKDSKAMPVYALVPAKGGPKLKPAEATENMPMGRAQMMMGTKGVHLIGKMTVAQLADRLSSFSDRTVLDKTDLKGTYDIDLEFIPDALPGGMPMRMGPPPGGGGDDAVQHREDSDAASLFTAIQEKLGLKLDPQKAPVDVYVIDHAEKVPTEN